MRPGLSPRRPPTVGAGARGCIATILLVLFLAPLPLPLAADNDDTLPAFDDPDDVGVPMPAHALAVLPMRPPTTPRPARPADVDEEAAADSNDIVPSAATSPRSPPVP